MKALALACLAILFTGLVWAQGPMGPGPTFVPTPYNRPTEPPQGWRSSTPSPSPSAAPLRR